MKREEDLGQSMSEEGGGGQKTHNDEGGGAVWNRAAEQRSNVDDLEQIG